VTLFQEPRVAALQPGQHGALEAALAVAEVELKAAAIARAAAAQMAKDREAQARDFNLFRISAMSWWLLANALLILAAVLLDSDLALFSSIMAVSVFFFTGVRLLGSAAFQLGRLASCGLRAGCCCLFRVRPSPLGGDRLHWRCCGSVNEWAADDVWAASSYSHVFPQQQPGSSNELLNRPEPHRGSEALFCWARCCRSSLRSQQRQPQPLQQQPQLLMPV
jgi:hypothetical protein